LIEFIHELLNIAEITMANHLLFQVNGDISKFDLNVIDNLSKHDTDYYFELWESDA
jgi:alkyl hydroperoxide reductase subunit AhpF